MCGLKGSRGEWVVLTSKKKPPLFWNPSADRQTEHSPTLILISLISLVWGSVLIQMGHARKYQPDSLCQERAGKKRTACSCVSLTGACSETSCVGAWAALLLELEKNSDKKFLPFFSVSCHQETSLQGSTEEYILSTKNQLKCLN